MKRRLTKTLKKKFQGVNRKGLYAYFMDPYKPELYYMRGPGPKWQEKHGSLSKTENGSDSRLVVAPSGQTRVSPDTLPASQR